MVQDACAYIEPEGSGRHVEWRRCADVNGVRVSLARLPESPIVLIKGSVAVRVTDIGKIASYFAHIDSTAAMRHSLEKLDPMFRDGRVICRLPTSSSPPPPREGAGGKLVVRSAPVAGEEPTGRTQVEWACFDAPSPLAPRDFCWLEHSSYARTPGGSLLFLSLCTSVEREEAPDMWKSHGYVRAALTSTGYIFKQTDEASEEWELSYVVQVRRRARAAACARSSGSFPFGLIFLCAARLSRSRHQIDPKGIIPTWVVNLVATDQASNAAAMRDAVAERLLAEEALRSPARGPEEKGAGSSAEQGWASVPLQEALLARDGGSAVVSLGQLASGRTVEWRWMAGSEAQAKHAHVSCQLEMEAVSVAGPDGGEAKGRRQLPARREDALEHEAERAADHATPAGTARVHTCRARTRASAQHWIKFRRTRTLLERLHWSGTRPLTIFLQVRQL